MSRTVAVIASVFWAQFATCQTSSDLTVFEAVVADVRSPNPDLGPGDQTLGAAQNFSVTTSSAHGARETWLQSQKIEIVPDTTGVRCLGFTVIAEATNRSLGCPSSVSTIARIGPLVSGVGEAARQLPPDMLVRPALHSMAVTMTLLMPDGSSTVDYIYVVEIVGGAVKILKRVQPVAS